MIVSVQSPTRLNAAALPEAVGGAHWVSDYAGTRLAFVEGRSGLWHVEPSEGLTVRGVEGRSIQAIDLDPHKPAVMNIDGSDGQTWCVIFQPDDAQSLVSNVFGFSGDSDLSVGRAADNSIVYDNGFVSGHHMRLSYVAGSWKVADLESTNGVFLNGERVPKGATLTARFGDVVTALGLHVTLGSGFFSCNNPGGQLSITRKDLVRYEAPILQKEPIKRSVERPLFYPALRFARAVEKKSFTIDAPPQKEKEDKTSLLQRIGPSMLMGFASLMSAAVFVTMMADQGSSMLRAVPMVCMAIAMLAGSVVWPIFNRRHERVERERNESIRRGAYSQYLSEVLSEIAKEEELQREILMENRIPVDVCMGLASRGDAHLMDRAPLHADYLDVRIGVGEEPFQADIRFPDQHFTVDEDDLREAVNNQARAPRILKDVPIALPLIEKHIVGIIGDAERTMAFGRGIVVQLATLCSYEDVKVVVLCDEVQRDSWSFASHVPHCFTDDRRMRFFGVGLEETGEIGLLLERVLEERKATERFEARDAAPYYVIVCASNMLSDKANVVRAILEERENCGMSLISLAPEMKDLPKECRSVIELGVGDGFLLDRDDPSGARKRFVPDIFVSVEDAESFAFSISKVRLDLAIEKKQMPSHLGFLEMYGVGSVGHFNIPSRWVESNASATLAACVGVDVQGEPFLLNLHEKFHGPHGLIAGTTGSGKSEFIITYILSMALTYSPHDVAFVLIDYKGGGLAKAFDNEHVRLPHLAGVITNLDGAAITRSLVSIQSELKRRQALFNRARDVVGGDNVDIYDYLGLFRQGRMTEPCPHLFIVADEFAELKQQQPEFMDELISAARIGRSLGVHLVLATQKPSGVVNDQIWSNARFKICLKVADAADSNEMIRRPDAAELQEAGRFFLLVGYNEYFALGQSGYAGTRYVAKERFERVKDDTVSLLSDTGRALVSVKPRMNETTDDNGPESVALLAAIQQASKATGLVARQLWLAPIPALITVDGLATKYGSSFGELSRDFTLDPIVGEFDDPSRQRQGVLTLPLSEVGNALVYGTPDSGVECVLNEALYSIVRKHDASSVNAYALDFGSESLKAFVTAPQVGDVIGIAEEEKVGRFFDFFEAEFASRRALLSEYGGSFARYAEAVGDLPAIVIVLNDIAAFLEAYPLLEDRLGKLVREAGRSGIYLIATAAGTSSVRVRMRQNFRLALAVNLADTTDYGMIFGTMRGLPQPKGFGRGLVQMEEGIFEFQAARLAEDGDDFGFAAGYCRNSGEIAQVVGDVQAPAIPTVPDRVSPAMGAAFPATDDFLPYGINDADLSPAGFDFSDSPLARVQFQRRKDGLAFTKAFLASMQGRDNWEVALLDMAKLFGDEKPEGCAFATRQDEFAKSYMGTVFERKARRANDPCLLLLCTGITDFVNRSGIEFAPMMKDFLCAVPPESRVRVLLVDSSSDTSYTYEDWFKANLTNKDGLWVGPGIESQSVISVSYNARFANDADMDETRGYAVDGGVVRLVHLFTLEKEEDDARGGGEVAAVFDAGFERRRQ